MKRYIIAGILIFLVSAIAFAPAGIVSRGLSEVTNEVVLLEPRGTIWNGQGNLISGGERMGNLRWQLQPLSLLMLNPTADWQLSGTDLDLYGTVTGLTELHTTTNGELDLATMKGLFSRYDLAIPGVVELDTVVAQFDPARQTLTFVDGQLVWSGGQVRYVLAGILSESILPKMRAELSMQAQMPTADVYAEGEPIRLMQAQIKEDGFVKIGISKMFTKLLNRTWPGSDPDHAIVLEVEEQLL